MSTDKIVAKNLTIGYDEKIIIKNASFAVKNHDIFIIMGGSGCGKSTMGRAILRLFDITSGEVYFKGKLISSLKDKDFDPNNPEMVRRIEEEAARAEAEEEARRAAELAAAEEETVEEDEIEEIEEVEEVDEETSAKTTKTTARKSTTRKRKPTTRKTTTARRSPRRKIDSDIIGGINFD